MNKLLAIVAVTAMVGTAHADGPKSETWVITDRVQENGQPMRHIPIGEVTRAPGGAVTFTGKSALELDKITYVVAAAWKSYKPKPSITITEHLPERIAMRRTPDATHSAAFTPADAMYMPAAIRAFAETHGLKLRGLSSQFIEFDTHHGPPNVDDAVTTFDNFRKGTGPVDYQAAPKDYIYLWLDRPVRPEGETEPVRSTRHPEVALQPNTDSGARTVATLKLFRDGHVDYTPYFARDELQNHWRTYQPRDLVVQVLEHGDRYTEYKVAKDAPHNLEAQILQYLVRGAAYTVSPPIDPAQFK